MSAIAYKSYKLAQPCPQNPKTPLRFSTWLLVANLGFHKKQMCHILLVKKPAKNTDFTCEKNKYKYKYIYIYLGQSVIPSRFDHLVINLINLYSKSLVEWLGSHGSHDPIHFTSHAVEPKTRPIGLELAPVRRSHRHPMANWTSTGIGSNLQC